MRRIAIGAALALLAAYTPAGARPEARVVAADTIPTAVLVQEHLILQGQLAAAADQAGPIGDAAQRLAEVLEPHLQWEEAIVQPLLSMLRPLAEGHAPAGARALIPLADSLAARLPAVAAEHQRIIAAATQLEEVAWDQGDPRWAAIAGRLRDHAAMEEQVLYPAALLVGEALRWRARQPLY